MFSKFLFPVIFISLFIFTTCKRNQQNTTTENNQPQQQQQAQNQGSSSGMNMGQQQGQIFTGKVIETIDAGSYTYVNAVSENQNVWAAAPKFKVEKDQMVQFSMSMPMVKYQSKILNRTFDLVYFTNKIALAGTEAPAPMDTHTTAENINSNPAANTMQKGPEGNKVTFDFSAIKKAGKGYRIEELYEKPDQFAGKTVEVRGVVVKYNQGILGKNWLHLQDGTGKEQKNDLTVTTDSTAGVGDVVVASANLVKDKDFGMGYKYSIILENAKVVKESTLQPKATK